MTFLAVFVVNYVITTLYAVLVPQRLHLMTVVVTVTGPAAPASSSRVARGRA